MEKPVVCRVKSKVKKFRDKTLKANRLGLSWTDKGSKSLPTVKRRFKSTNSRLIMAGGVYKNWMKRSSCRKKKFVVLIKETNDADKSINFFMNSYWSKTGIFVKLMRKFPLKQKNWSDFMVLRSRQLQEEDCSMTKIPSLNSLARYRNCKMKLIVWMIREIFKMLNQYAVEIPTLPVNLCLSHLIQFLVECRSAKMGRQAFGTRMVCRETFLQIQFASSTAPFPQELNPWSFHISDPIHSSTAEKNENRTPVQDLRCQSGPSARNSVIRSEGDSSRNFGSRPTTADLRSSFRQIPYTSNVCLLEDNIQDWGMYLFTISYGGYAVDQRSGVGWFSGWIKIFAINTRYFDAEFWSTWCKDCFSTEQNHP